MHNFALFAGDVAQTADAVNKNMLRYPEISALIKTNRFKHVFIFEGIVHPERTTNATSDIHIRSRQNLVQIKSLAKLGAIRGRSHLLGSATIAMAAHPLKIQIKIMDVRFFSNLIEMNQSPYP